MKVFVQCPELIATGLPPNVAVDIEESESIGSLKSLVASRLGLELIGRVLVQHGSVLEDSTPVTTLGSGSTPSSATVQLIQDARLPWHRSCFASCSMSTVAVTTASAATAACNCGYSKAMLRPTLPPLQQVIGDDKERNLVIRNILCTPIVNRLLAIFDCRMCSDEDLAKAFNSFHTRVLNEKVLVSGSSIFSLCERRTEEVMTRLKAFIEMQMFEKMTVGNYRQVPLSLEEARQAIKYLKLDDNSTMGQRLPSRRRPVLVSAAPVAAPAAAGTGSSAPSSGPNASAAGSSAQAGPAPISADHLRSSLSLALSSMASGSSSGQSSTGGRPPARPPQQQHADTASSSRAALARHQRGQQRALETQRARFETELSLMKAMGFENDNINVQALVMTDGDVEQAIQLVSSGAFS